MPTSSEEQGQATPPVSAESKRSSNAILAVRIFLLICILIGIGGLIATRTFWMQPLMESLIVPLWTKTVPSSFTASSTEGMAQLSETFTFTVTNILDTCGPLPSMPATFLSIHFGDGTWGTMEQSPATSRKPSGIPCYSYYTITWSTSHAYRSPGTYAVTLDSNDFNTVIAVATTTVTVTAPTSATLPQPDVSPSLITPLPSSATTPSNLTTSQETGIGIVITGNLTATPNSGRSPLAVRFDALGLNEGTTNTVNFGDGTNGQIQIPAPQCPAGACKGNLNGAFGGNILHTYQSAGTYIATLLGPQPKWWSSACDSRGPCSGLTYAACPTTDPDCYTIGTTTVTVTSSQNTNVTAPGPVEQACVGKSAGDPCTVYEHASSSTQDTWTGTCRASLQGSLMCIPQFWN